MKITYTLTEAKEALQQFVRTNQGLANLTVDIVPDEVVKTDYYSRLVALNGLSIPPDKKILSIKNLREFCANNREFCNNNPPGLADAKFIVEHWSEFLSKIKLDETNVWGCWVAREGR